MSENMQCHINLRNNTNGTLSLTGSPLDWGKWSQNPPAQITAGQTGSFYAEGAKGSATGTQGSATYSFPDNATSLTISFDIPYDGSNSGGGTMAGSGMSTYTFKETGDDYSTAANFPTSGDSVTAYFAAGLSPSSAGARDLAELVRNRLAKVGSPGTPKIDIATAARMINCGAIAGPELVRIFKGKAEATALDVLRSGAASPEQLTNFVAQAKLLHPSLGFKGAVDFAAEVVGVLKPEPEAHALAEDIIMGLRALADGGSTDAFNDQVSAIEKIQGGLTAFNFDGQNMPSIAAIDAILACIYMGTDAALAQTATCALQTMRSEEERKRLAHWQLAYLEKAAA